MSKRPGFMFYFDEATAFERVSDSEAGVLIKAMIAYCRTGELLPLEGTASIIFDIIRPKLDRDAVKYNEQIMKRKYGGYIKACRDRGDEPLSFESWRDGLQVHEQACACTSMQTITPTATASKTTTSTATESTYTKTDAAISSKDSGKENDGGNRLTPDEFEKARQSKINMLLEYGNKKLRP